MNILERLEAWALYVEGDGPRPACEPVTFSESAAEIARLSAALQWISNDYRELQRTRKLMEILKSNRSLAYVKHAESILGNEKAGQC